MMDLLFFGCPGRFEARCNCSAWSAAQSEGISSILVAQCPRLRPTDPMADRTTSSELVLGSKSTSYRAVQKNMFLFKNIFCRKILESKHCSRMFFLIKNIAI